MADGYMGKILRVDLTKNEVSIIDTEKYKKWGGGNGIGTALFWDECEDVTVDGLDPRNVVTIMTSPLSGTIAPAASGRTEVQGNAPQAYPVNWFTRSNFGGRFSGMLKFAGWDGIVIKGKAKEPCWLDIRNDKVTIQSAKGIWGLDTFETQEEIWRRLRETSGYSTNGWYTLEKGRDTGNTTFDPAVLTIGPIGETLSPAACLIHEAANGSGQGGFGAVFGSKNLKAVSVIGTGEVDVANMTDLMDTRLWMQKSTMMGNYNTPQTQEMLLAAPGTAANSLFKMSSAPGNGAGPVFGVPQDVPSVPYGCLACVRCCRRRFSNSKTNGSTCVDFAFFGGGDAEAHGAAGQDTFDASEMMQRAGINDYVLLVYLPYLRALAKLGVLGPGKQIDTDLPIEEEWGESNLLRILIDKMEKQEDIGKYLHMSLVDFAKAIGRYEEDSASGLFNVQYWGYPQHYDARTEVEWGYGTLMGDRDINEHDFNDYIYWTPSLSIVSGLEPPYTAEEYANVVSKVIKPYDGDPLVVDYSDEGIYSEHMAKLVAWHRHYTRYYKQSMQFCDWCYSDIFNPYNEGHIGLTGEVEPRIINAITNKNESFLDGMELGRKIWNFDRAIWCLQGRTCEMEKFAPYTYTQPAAVGGEATVPYIMPTFEGGKWDFRMVSGRMLDDAKVEDWKQKYYKLEGWTTDGVPTRETLEELDLNFVADALEKEGRL